MTWYVIVIMILQEEVNLCRLCKKLGALVIVSAYAKRNGDMFGSTLRSPAGVRTVYSLLI